MQHAELAEQLAQSLPPLSKNAETVLAKRYLDRDDAGNVQETVNGLFWRVAYTLAKEGLQRGQTLEQVEETAQRYFRLMRGGKALPNSPTLANAGTRTGQLSACFVIPVSDAFSNKSDGIYDALTKAQLIQQTGGGVGYSFSKLREKNAIVETTKGIASGPVSFMDVFDVACAKMAQGGMRRGAQMGILRVDHPDILEFIDYKQDLSKLTNFNVSVAITDAFLDALAVNGDYELVSPKTGPTGQTLNAKEVWTRIIRRAHATGEPGVVFIDRMNRYNPVPGLGSYEATNPCGEQPLIPYESCNLASIVTDQFVLVDEETGATYIDWQGLKESVFTTVFMMDDVVDANAYVPSVPEIGETTRKTRKLGLGVMGLARMLFKLGIPYDSNEGRYVVEEVFAFIDVQSKLASIDRSRQFGPYPYFQDHPAECTAFYQRVWSERIARAEAAGMHEIAQLYRDALAQLVVYGMRNSTTTTIAPTGTISIIADTSGGCEPEFALVISRRQADTEMFEANPVFAAELARRGFSAESIQAIYQMLGRNQGSLVRALEDIEQLAMISPGEADVLYAMSKVYVVAGDIAPRDHVLMQATIQQYNDSATSKTINFPEEATVEQVEEAYNLAIQTGCKGITIYRNNSRQYQPLTAGDQKALAAETMEGACEKCEEEAQREEIARGLAKPVLGPRKRQEDLYGFTRRIETGEGRLYITLNYDAEGVREIVLNVGKSGGHTHSLVESLGRVISMALQHRTPLKDIARQLVGVRGGSPLGFGPRQVLSIPDAIGKVLMNAPETMEGILSPAESVPRVETVPAEKVMTAETRAVMLDLGHSPDCPECGSALSFGEGCALCHGCGYSRCS